MAMMFFRAPPISTPTTSVLAYNRKYGARNSRWTSCASTGSFSRNRHVGVELGRGRPIGDVLAGMKMVAEGVRTTSVALALGRKHGVELPIATQMAGVLSGSRSAVLAVEELMLRPQKTEQESR